MHVISAQMRNSKNVAAPGIVYWDGRAWTRRIEDAAQFMVESIAARIAKNLSREWDTHIYVGKLTAPLANGRGSRRRNPVPLSSSASLKASRTRFKDFRGDDPGSIRPVKVPVPKSAMVVGELAGVLYDTVRDGKRENYIHKFRKKSRPLLAASDDGKSLHIVGGQYEFTERGIVDN